MDRSERKKLIIVFLMIAAIALCKDISDGVLEENNCITRGSLEDSSKEAKLQLKIEGLKDNYSYDLEVMPVLVTKQQAKDCFKKAKREIAQTDVDDERVNFKESYAQGLVEAEWKFHPLGYIDSNGYIDWEEIIDETAIVQAEVKLTCGAYEDMYKFEIPLSKSVLSESEQIIRQIDDILQKQMQQEGSDKIQLPDVVNGKQLYWEEEKEYLVFKVLLLELCTMVLLVFARKREVEAEKKKVKMRMEYEYSDIVNQLSVLLGAGMTTRQAWSRMAKQYLQKKQLGLVEENPLYEGIVHMVNSLTEGESQRRVYEMFAEEIDVPCFRRLMRALIVNLEKGSAGLIAYLESEEKIAYENKLLQAKKMGEEASTKLLIPLMLQMILIMAVILAPAMIGFMN